MESPVSSHIGFVECLTVFDHVFATRDLVGNKGAA